MRCWILRKSINSGFLFLQCVCVCVCVYRSIGGRVDKLLLEGMRKVKFRTMKEMYGGTKEEFEQPTKACTFAASLCVSF